jgi:hypothetical protein
MSVFELTQQIPQSPESSSKNRSILIVALVIGLVVGLVLGVFISVVFNLPSSFHKGAGTNNQVQVSGSVQVTQSGTIGFDNLNRTIETSGIISNGEYSVLLVGGQSYDVYVYIPNDSYRTYSLYVPLGVTTFTANF